MLRFNRNPPLPEYRVHLHPPKKYKQPRQSILGRVYWARRVPRPVLYLVGIALLILLYYVFTWKVHVEIQFYKRSWVRQEILPVEPVSAKCFPMDKTGAESNITQALYAPMWVELHAGLDMKLGMDCYDFAGTIPRPHALSRDEYFSKPPLPREERTNFHTYWRADLESFGERQEWMLKSFFATQDVKSVTLILWSNDGAELEKNVRVQLYLKAYPHAFEVRTVDVKQMAKETALNGSPRLQKTHDTKAWVDGDLVRLLVIWQHGGVWVDMDSLLTRDLTPLLNHEFVTQWDCYDKIYQPMNGALMHFRKHSAYLCEAFHIMATSRPPRPGSTDWGSFLYYKLWRRLVASSVPPFKVLPFCFSDGRSCRMDNRLPDPFATDSRTWGKGLNLKEGGPLDKVLDKIFAVHLHNQWDKPFPPDGWVDRLLLKRFTDHLPPSSPS